MCTELSQRKEIIKIYRLYKHKNLANGKVYIGITAKNPIIRWNEGDGYKSNTDFYNDIKKYGWDEGFSHEILLENLTKGEAIIKECEFILKFDSVHCGYNLRYADKKSLLPDYLTQEIKKRQLRDRENIEYKYFKSKEFDLTDFKIFNSNKKKYRNTVNYFTRIPNKFIQCNLQKDFGVSRILLVVFCEVDRNRSYEDISYICIRDIFDKCNYKISTTKPKIFYEILKCLLFLKENNYIECNFDPYKVSYNDCIKINIIREVFDASDSFTKVYGKNMDWIFTSETKLSKESIITVFLYINSYIGCRSKQNDGSEYKNAKDNPEAFYRSIKQMAEELSMSKDTINQCIGYLTTSSNTTPALLIKREVGSVQPDKSKPPKNVPNIYVLNKEGYQQEIEWALSKMLELYKVDEFYPSKSGNYRYERKEK